MFSRKKAQEAPTVISLEEIEADLASFSSQQSSLQAFTPSSKQELVDEILEEENLEISTWWKIFKIFQSQFRDIQSRASEIDELKSVIGSQTDELKEKRELLVNEIEENYQKVLKLKTPE